MKRQMELYQRQSTERVNTKRLALFIVGALFQAGQYSVASQNEITVKSDREKAILGHSFVNRTETKMGKCLQHCLAHCRCASFQICDGNKCELCSTNKYLMPNALQARSGCTHYDISTDSAEIIKLSNEQCSSGCKRTGSCCLTSQPCRNGGTCVPTRGNQTRFRCNCAPGYQGKRCGTRQCDRGYTGERCGTRQCDRGYTGANCETPITSCHGYAGEGEQKPGTYKVINVYSNQSYDVYCHFDSVSGLTWTRLQSYQMQQRETFETPFMINKPRNEDTPSNINYRLSRQRMESIRQDSRYWAISCWSFSGLDSISVSLNKLDILTYEGAEACFEVEYVAVGSRNCSKHTAQAGGCTVLLKQSASEPIHSIYYQPDTKNHCTFRPNDKAYCSSAGGGKKDNYFGFGQCYNTDHQCSKSAFSTIQTWFGG